ncbi:MAG: hypothetical protein K0Q94_3616 [Paenibacillus sp.]|jgi:hypothetical protein|nr:hypothetical protein [Paenibacillus sp.]
MLSTVLSISAYKNDRKRSGWFDRWGVPQTEGVSYILTAFAGVSETAIQQIAEPANVMDPNINVDSKITENRSAIPLFTIMIIPNGCNNGSLLRYIREYNGIRDNKGIQFLYYCNELPPSSKVLQIILS